MSDDYLNAELTGLPNSFFEQNRQKLLSNIDLYLPNLDKDSILLLKGGDNAPKYDTDSSYCEFYQEANFYYLTGVREPGLDGVLDLKSRQITLFYDQPSDSTKYWQKVITSEEMKAKYQLDIYSKRATNDWIATRDPASIYVFEGFNDISNLPIFGYMPDFSGKYEPLKSKLKSEPKFISVFRESRKVKTPEEIKLMTYICKETVKTHQEMMKAIKPGMYERDMENIFNNVNADNYFTRIWGYACIAGCGVNGATLHYEVNNKLMKEGELFLADMGMRFCNYVSDVTITIPVNKKFTDRQKEIYDIVLKSNRDVMKMVKPGVILRDISRGNLDLESKKIILLELQKIGIINSGFTVEEMIDAEIQKIFMPHGLGHYVGIEVHDVYDTNLLNKDGYELQAGNVITIEPGIYFRDFLLDRAISNPNQSKFLNVEKLKTYYDFGGIRIEDDVLVTNDGYFNLTDSLPRTTEDIEKLMNSG